MKKNILLLLSLCLGMLSCSEEIVPSINLNKTEFAVSDAGGSQTISFESNMNWTATSSENWCVISPSNGDASVKGITVKLSANDTYSARNCNVIITAGSMSKTLTINQNSNLGLLVTQDKYNLTNDAATIEVEVKGNVEYDVTISGDWITRTTTRGLSSTKLYFNIAKNGSYDNRNGSITIKQKNGTLTSTIKVFQSQEDAIIISKKIEELSSENQKLEVELKTNVEFEVIIPDDAISWVSYNATRALRSEKLLLNITENKGDEARSAEIYVKNRLTTLQDTLTIHQRALNVFRVDKIGTLGTILNQTQKDTISIMTLKGEINKADFEVMKSQMPKLRHLDLSDVKCEDNKIPDEAFGANYHGSNQNISLIILPISITSIGKYAFNNCLRLAGPLDLPVGLITIGERAFGGCSRFTGSLTLPSGLTTIGEFAFGGCSGFSGSLTLPPGLTEIAKGLFILCSKFTGNLNLPVGLTTIGESAFMDCSGFTGSLTFPPGLTTIGQFAFQHCYGFSGALSFPDDLTTIGPAAFENCHGFTSLNLPANMTTIKYQTFSQCGGFKGVLTLPGGLTMIESQAFANCSGFTGALNLPVGLTTIGGSAFANCSGFTELEFGNNIVAIEESAYINCSNISGKVIFPKSLNYIKRYAFEGCVQVEAFRFPHTTPLPYYHPMFPQGATVQVPTSAVEIYKATDGWKNFKIGGYFQIDGGLP